MTLLSLLLALAVLGLVVYVLTDVLPIDSRLAVLIRIVAIVVALLWVARYFGLHVPSRLFP